MFAAVQTPLADLRHFVDERTGRLPAPPWPLAKPSKQFVRAVGPVRRRKRGGVKEWIGESLYCDAQRAMVFFLSERGNLDYEESAPTHLTPQYRRFYATGRANWPGAIARMDVGFKVSGRNANGRVTGRVLPSPQEAALAALRVVLWVPPDDQPRMLLNAGDAIATKIRTVTTSLKVPPPHMRPWWVQAGCPLVLVEAPFTRECIAALDPPLDVDTVASAGRDALALHHFSYVEDHATRVPVWTLIYNEHISPVTLRLLRIHLWKLHNEREVLRLVLAACLQQQVDPSQPALRDYLARQGSSLRQTTRDGLPQAELLYHAYALDALVNENDIEELSEILRDVSPGMAASIMPLAGDGPPVPALALYFNFNGGLQVAQNIDNSDASQSIKTHGPVGAIIGGKAKVKGGNYQGSGKQNIQILDTVDMSQLADDLQRLAAKLDEQSRTPKQQAELEQVQKAAVAARQGDKTSVWEHLTQAGKWVLGIARDVGVEVAAAVISAAIGA